MTREFCSYCGTVTNDGERMCQTRAESEKCRWMVGVAREQVVTEIDGCMVHGDAPMTDASKAAMREVIAAVKAKLKT